MIELNILVTRKAEITIRKVRVFEMRTTILLTFATGLEHYQDPEWNGDGDSEADESGYGYGPYSDVHERLCSNKDMCDICQEEKMWRYDPWL